MKSVGTIEAQRRLTFFYATGVYLLALAILLPHAGHNDGKTFLEIAVASPWTRWWDWPAVWCSLKLILLMIGAVLLMSACGMALQMFHRRWAARVFFALAGLSAFGCWGGAYLLLKAVF